MYKSLLKVLPFFKSYIGSVYAVIGSILFSIIFFGSVEPFFLNSDSISMVIGVVLGVVVMTFQVIILSAFVHSLSPKE